MKLVKYFIFLSLLVFVSCKKKEYPKTVIDPTKTFYFNANINGAPISIAAGENNYYMYSSYKQDSNNVYGFIGDLKQSDCSNCLNRLTIKINDDVASALGAAVHINQSLSVRNYPYFGPSYAVKFQSVYNKTAGAYLWNFGDGSSSTAAAPIHTFSAYGNYKVSLKISETGINPCVGSISNVERIGYPLSNFITAVADSNNVIHFNANAQGNGPYSYLWYFGDGSTSSAANPSHAYSIVGSYPVELRVIDNANDTIYSNYNAITQNDQSSCATNYSITSITTVLNALALSAVNITWVDENGIIYSSNNPLQPSTSYFKVVSVDSYDNNENTETTKKLHVQFKCRVYNGVNYKTIDNADATICVSYK